MLVNGIVHKSCFNHRVGSCLLCKPQTPKGNVGEKWEDSDKKPHDLILSASWGIGWLVSEIEFKFQRSADGNQQKRRREKQHLLNKKSSRCLELHLHSPAWGSVCLIQAEHKVLKAFFFFISRFQAVPFPLSWMQCSNSWKGFVTPIASEHHCRENWAMCTALTLIPKEPFCLHLGKYPGM